MGEPATVADFATWVLPPLVLVITVTLCWDLLKDLVSDRDR